MIPYGLIVRIAGAGLLALALYLGYSHVKSIGYAEAEVVYQQKIREYEEGINKKIDTIEALSTSLVTNSAINNNLIAKDISDILNKVKDKPLVIIKNGKCTPSTTFSDTLNQINKRTNESMKESLK